MVYRHPYNVRAMSDVILWLITVELLGLAAFPLAYFLLPNLADRGYGFSKTLGILIVGYAAWILGVLHVVPTVWAGLAGTLVAMAAVSAWVALRRRTKILGFVRSHWRIIAFSELVFLAFFVGWTLFRLYDPGIDHTEQPMDFAFLNASIRSEVGHPEDPWLRGEAVSYYYFGYWMMGVISELSGVASNVSYNLAIALIPALASAGVGSLVISMVRSEGGAWRSGIVSGVAAGVVLGVASNLAGVLEFMRANAIGSQSFYDWIAIGGLDGPAEVPTQEWTPDEFWWWFRATRVINTFEDGSGVDYTIHEFPFFSFMLGDLHPHVLAIPFALLFAGLVFSFFRSGVFSLRCMQPWGYATVGAMGLALGGLAFTNMWDLPTGAALLIGTVAIAAYRRPDDGDAFHNPDDTSETDGAEVGLRLEPISATLQRTGLAVAQVPAVVLLLGFVLYLPYYTGFTASISGIGAVVTPSRPVHTFIVWGMPLAIVGPFVVVSFWRTIVREDWRRMAMISILVALLPYVVWLVARLQSPVAIGSPTGRFIHILPLALLVGMSSWSALHEVKERGPTGRGFALALATLGLVLIIGPELLFVDDYFEGSSQRMNTVFKLYYQAWVLLSVVSGFAVHEWLRSRPRLSGRRRTLSTIWAVLAITLVGCGFYYTAAASVSKAGDFAGRPTLDGLEFVRGRSPAEYEAIRFVRDTLPTDAAIVESIDEWSDAGLISRSTGVPTIFNWPGHELQWRGSSRMFDSRTRDVTRIYETVDTEVAQNLLEGYNVEYVYVGPREKEKHEGPGLGKFPDFMDTVFQMDDVTIYRLRE